MRILLVRPPVPFHTIGLRHLMICEPLELEYVAAGLAGHEVAILDLILERGLEKQLRGFRPDVVGTTCYINGVNEAIRICRLVKRWNPHCRTVIGGVQASLAPEDFYDPAVDCLVLGDGTSAIGRIIEHFANGMSLQSIPNLAIRTDDGQVVLTSPAEYMPDPDSLPLPRRELVRNWRHRYYYLFHQPVTLMKTTWGCWYDCNFCVTWRVTGGRPYSRSAESIVDELSRIESADVYIVDDIFLINPRRLTEIAELLLRRSIKKNYLVYGRADFIAENEEIIRVWQKVGLTAVIVGLEATTDHELDQMEKHATVDQNRRTIEVLRKHHVDIYGSFITGPDYLPEDWNRLWRFIEDNGLYYVNISPWTPMPGAPVWQDAEKRLSVPRRAHGLWDLSHPVVPTAMSTRGYYRELSRVYAKTVLNLRRAESLTLRTRPPIWSRRYLRLWLGAMKIFFQFRRAHLHHTPSELANAMECGPESRGVPESSRVQTPMAAPNDHDIGSGPRAPIDPFDGFFGTSDHGVREIPDLIAVPAARRWFHVVGWGMRENLYTYLQPIRGRSGPRAQVSDGRFVMASSYDYLGLIGHPDIERAAIEAVRTCGTGTSGVRLLTGTNELHCELESQIAAFKGTEASVTFSSGYAANVGVIAALVGPHDFVIADQCIHRSILDGCRLAGAPISTFRHNDPNALEDLLKNNDCHPRILVVVEGVYSMDGDICPLPEIVALRNRYGFILFVDEAHSFGTLGHSGRGVNEHFRLAADVVDVWMGTLSKAIPSNGGFIAGSRALAIFLQHAAAPFMFSAALAPASVSAAAESLRIIDREQWRLVRLRDNSKRLREGIHAMDFDIGRSTSAIIPVILRNDELTYRVSRSLYGQGILASAIVAPAVRHGTSRLRLCATAAMDSNCINAIIAGLQRSRNELMTDKLPLKSG